MPKSTKTQRRLVVIQLEIDNQFMTTAKVTPDEYNFLSQNIKGYHETKLQLDKLTDDGFLVTNIPIKLQSLKEKKSIIDNFEQCIEWYNQWVETNQFGKKFSDEEIANISDTEENKLNAALQLRLTNNS